MKGFWEEWSSSSGAGREAITLPIPPLNYRAARATNADIE